MLQRKSSGSLKILSVDKEKLIRELKKIAQRLKKEKNAERVLLFGSFAKGNFTPSSDLDILIVVKRSDLPFIKRRDEFAPYFEHLPFDANILIYTEDELKKIENRPFIKEILNYSVELS